MCTGARAQASGAWQQQQQQQQEVATPARHEPRLRGHSTHLANSCCRGLVGTGAAGAGAGAAGGAVLACCSCEGVSSTAGACSIGERAAGAAGAEAAAGTCAETCLWCASCSIAARLPFRPAGADCGATGTGAAGTCRHTAAATAMTVCAIAPSCHSDGATACPGNHGLSSTQRQALACHAEAPVRGCSTMPTWLMSQHKPRCQHQAAHSPPAAGAALLLGQTPRAAPAAPCRAGPASPAPPCPRSCPPWPPAWPPAGGGGERGDSRYAVG
jgi:hypothetical protein